MTERPFKFDEIGYWSELKLEIVEKYGAAYTKAFANFPNLKKYYIDSFSGAGMGTVETPSCTTCFLLLPKMSPKRSSATSSAIWVT